MLVGRGGKMLVNKAQQFEIYLGVGGDNEAKAERCMVLARIRIAA